MNEIKNKNLFIFVSQKEKNVIELNAEKCGLSVSEYNSLIERIEVHTNDKSSGHCYVKVDIFYCGWYDRYSNRTGNSCYDGGNTGKSAGHSLCSIREERYGVTHFTELHRTLHENFLIWRCQNSTLFFYY